MNVIRELHPVAKKEHICMFCGCKINRGDTYSRKTIVNDGEIYDWICHDECLYLISVLDTQTCVDEGVSFDDFNVSVDQYIYDNKEKLPRNIDMMTRREQVRLIIAQEEEKI